MAPPASWLIGWYHRHMWRRVGIRRRSLLDLGGNCFLGGRSSEPCSRAASTSGPSSAASPRPTRRASIQSVVTAPTRGPGAPGRAQPWWGAVIDTSSSELVSRDVLASARAPNGLFRRRDCRRHHGLLRVQRGVPHAHPLEYVCRALPVGHPTRPTAPRGSTMRS
jgi:hypothetical protein